MKSEDGTEKRVFSGTGWFRGASIIFRMWGCVCETGKESRS